MPARVPRCISKPLRRPNPARDPAKSLTSTPSSPRAQQEQAPQNVIACFTNEDQGWLGTLRGGLSYTGEIVAAKAEGRGTIIGGRWTLRDAEFRGGRLVPCRAVKVWRNGDAYAGPLDSDCNPPKGARASFVRGTDGAVFQGGWPAEKTGCCSRPDGGAAVVFPSGSVHRVKFRGEVDIASSGPTSHGFRWGPGEDGWGPAVCVMERPTADEVRPPSPPPGERERAGGNRPVRECVDARGKLGFGHTLGRERSLLWRGGALLWRGNFVEQGRMDGRGACISSASPRKTCA